MPCSSQCISEMLPDIRTMNKCHFQTCKSISNNLILCYTCTSIFVVKEHKIADQGFRIGI